VGVVAEPVIFIFVHKFLAVGRAIAFSSASFEIRRYVELFESLAVALEPEKVAAYISHKEYDLDLHHPPDLSFQNRIDSPFSRVFNVSSKTDLVVLIVE
jgi:hypothetical protein